MMLAATWLDTFTKYVDKVDDMVWGTTFEIGGIPFPLVIMLILFGGILLTVRLGGMQFVRLPLALKYMLMNEKVEGGAKGEVSSFGALCTALSATIGTGNIVGVATAYVAGGPGAIFWMWLAALFGMATKYAEGLLAVKYREHDEVSGHTLGGPFYYIETALKRIGETFAISSFSLEMRGRTAKVKFIATNASGEEVGGEYTYGG